MSLITSFDPWKSPLCSCPAKLSLSAYTGCGHSCLYCYASSYIVNFYRPREKKNFLTRLRKEIKKIPAGSFITMANSSDPYHPLEKKMKLMQNALKILQGYNLKIMIVTKSPLILRDLGILKEFKHIVISFTLTTLNRNLAKKIEPFTFLPQDRLKTIEKLSRHLPLVCRFDPLIYPLNTKEIKKIVRELKNVGAKQIITSTYKVKADNFKRMAEAFSEHKNFWFNFYILNGQREAGYTYLPLSLRKKLIEEVRGTTLSQRLEFSSCREGFNQLNTKNCDGSSFFSR